MMTKTKIILVIYIIIFISLVSYTTTTIGTQQIVTKASFMRHVDVDEKKLFDLMSDVEKYPLILPDNVMSVSIINHTNNVIFATEMVQENGIRTQLTVKHTIFPYTEQIMEIMEGDAKGTMITEIFEGNSNNQTDIKTNLEIHLKGVLSPFAYLPSSNLEHAMNTIIDHFVDYIKKS